MGTMARTLYDAGCTLTYKDNSFLNQLPLLRLNGLQFIKTRFWQRKKRCESSIVKKDDETA